MSTVTMRAPAAASRPTAASNAARHSRSSSGSSFGTATTGLGGAASRTSEGQWRSLAPAAITPMARFASSRFGAKIVTQS